MNRIDRQFEAIAGGVFNTTGGDHWWSVDSTTDLGYLASEVVDAICSKAIPAMLEQIKGS